MNDNKKMVRDYVANLKWVTLKEFYKFVEDAAMSEMKLFSIVYTIEGIQTVSKKEKKKIYNQVSDLVIENPEFYNIYMSNLRSYAIDKLPNKLYEEVMGVPKNG